MSSCRKFRLLRWSFAVLPIQQRPWGAFPPSIFPRAVKPRLSRKFSGIVQPLPVILVVGRVDVRAIEDELQNRCAMHLLQQLETPAYRVTRGDAGASHKNQA